ncbi:MAG: amidohydrolase family protein [Saprospiraceae bacterium]
MIQIDSHQHFWQFDPVRDAWIDESMEVLRRDFLPEDLAPILKKHQLAGCIAVQADQSEAETNFLLDLAAKHSFIKGVVGWLDLRADNIEERLALFCENSDLKGLRHIAQAEPVDFLLRPDFQNGIKYLAPFGLSYDLLVFQHQLPAAIELVRQFPEQAFVLDHLAKPPYSEGMNTLWKQQIQTLASFPNVWCKISGMVTETKGFEWTKNDFLPFLEELLETFGPKRLMYGSDWPVCLLAADYQQQMEIVKTFISALSENEQAQIMGLNAIDFYRLQ